MPRSPVGWRTSLESSFLAHPILTTNAFSTFVSSSGSAWQGRWRQRRCSTCCTPTARTCAATTSSAHAALLDMLADASGHRPSDGELRQEIELTNAARAAARRLVALRRGAPRVSGQELFPCSARSGTSRRGVRALANQAAEDLADRSPLRGPRVLLAGAPVDGIGLTRPSSRAGPWSWTSSAHGAAPRGRRRPLRRGSDRSPRRRYRRRSIGPRLPAA
jgi:hypothetical protein